MTETATADPLELNSLFTKRLVRFRWIYFVVMIVLLLVPFNGQWRMGLDSSLYRGLADNLAAGKGYIFADQPQKQAYPGLPVTMAMIQKITGSNSVVPVLVLMNLCALVTLWVIYQLILTRYPKWIAIVVTFGVAVNIKFAQQAQEIMTDMPFLLGCMTAMLGWEKLGLSTSRKQTGRAIALLMLGMFLAAVMRPTFWVFALALVLTCLYNIIRNREKRSIIALVSMVIVGIVFAATDPRVRGMNILQGGYERELLTHTSDLLTRVMHNAPKLFDKEITETFFNEPLWHFAIPITALLLIGAAMTIPREPLWGLQVFILTGIMLILSDVPRYYVMVLPTLWLGYVLVVLLITRWIPEYTRDWVIFCMIGAANCMNFYGIAMLAYEQHRSDFVANYRDGGYVPMIKMANLLKEKIPDRSIVIGPHANLLTYLSGKNVFSGRSFGIDVQPVSKYPALLEAMHPKYMIGPSTTYKEKDPAMQKLIDKGVVVPTRYVANVIDPRQGMWLVEIKIVVPVKDWRSNPTTRPHVVADQKVRPTTRPKLTAEQIARKEIKAKRDRKAIKAYRERKARKLRKLQAATQNVVPATAPVTQPAQLP